VTSRPIRWNLSLRGTLLIAFAYVLVLVIIALEVPLVLNLSQRVDAEVKAEASAQAQLVATTATDELDQPGALERLVQRSARSLGGRVIVVDERGRLLADSVGPGLVGSSYASRPEIADALGGRASQGTRESSSLGETLLFTAAPVLRNGQNAGAIRVTQSVEAVQDAIRNDALALIGVGAVALLLGVGVGWVLAGFLARPPRALAATARSVAAGDLEARAPEQGPHEEQEVAAAFNEMTARLAASLEAQSDFVANASHQLRTPLTGLQLRIEAAAASSDPRKARAELVEAEGELDRLAGLLTNLLALARAGERSPEARAVSLAQCTRAARARWRARAEAHGQRLELQSDPGVEVLASGEDLGIILDNLIENAISYSPRGSEIAVRSGRRDGFGVLAVDDQGPGLAGEEAERVIERFYRGDAAAGTTGTGLGLAIVRVLARRWGGEVRLENLPEGGLRAAATLPLVDSDEPLPNVDLDVDDSLPGRASLRA
jgi:two-component system, OmpR family, sensor kinase